MMDGERYILGFMDCLLLVEDCLEDASTIEEMKMKIGQIKNALKNGRVEWLKMQLYSYLK